MTFWVYILRCYDGSYYTGHTDNLEKRVAEHASGALPGCYTFKRRPVELVFTRTFPTRYEALASERQIKGWSRKKKEAMMRDDLRQAQVGGGASACPFILRSFDKLRMNGGEM